MKLLSQNSCPSPTPNVVYSPHASKDLEKAAKAQVALRETKNAIVFHEKKLEEKIKEGKLIADQLQQIKETRANIADRLANNADQLANNADRLANNADRLAKIRAAKMLAFQSSPKDT